MQASSANRERPGRTISGWGMLVITIILLLGGAAVFIFGIVRGASSASEQSIWWMFILGLVAMTLAFVFMSGFFTLQPNETRLLILFGAYKGTARKTGFRWANPFYSNGPSQPSGASAHGQKSGTGSRTGVTKQAAGTTAKGQRRYKISLRARTLNGEKLKVNDKRGNPIEIAAVVVWHVHDTAQAIFDVDDYEEYVTMQSESAVRHLASAYAYDHGESTETTEEITLRSNIEEVSAALREELQQRLAKAGVVVDEARLTHLAYAPEIAQAMLRRQQAEAIIAARQKIVHGAVSMVDMALREMSERQVVELDDERKASMVSNLMVVLCGESEVHPVVNTGTLYP
ncbi:MAG: SPFH domain-containing protein [Actinobacteria bacterium]|nr:SPFH domain-containing protein [Actinomycetota bacterium]